MNLGSVLKGCIVYDKGDNRINYFQKVHVLKLTTPKVEVMTTVTTYTGTFYLWRKFKKWHNRVNEDCNINDTHLSKNKI